MSHARQFTKSTSAEKLVNWKSKFIEAGCAEDLIDFVLRKKVIEDYSHFYQQFKRLPHSLKKEISDPWELFCLSGEISAFDFITKEEEKNLEVDPIKKATVSKYGMTPLDYAILSGKPDQVKKALEFGIPLNMNKNNALSLAALSGSEEMIELIASKDKSQLSAVDGKGRTPLHLAAASGSLSAVKKLLTYVEVAISKEDGNGHNALVYSIAKGHDEINEFLKSKGLELNEEHLNNHSFGEHNIHHDKRATM